MKFYLITFVFFVGTLAFPQKYQFKNSFGKFINASSFYITNNKAQNIIPGYKSNLFLNLT